MLNFTWIFLPMACDRSASTPSLHRRNRSIFGMHNCEWPTGTDIPMGRTTSYLFYLYANECKWRNSVCVCVYGCCVAKRHAQISIWIVRPGVSVVIGWLKCSVVDADGFVSIYESHLFGFEYAILFNYVFHFFHLPTAHRRTKSQWRRPNWPLKKYGLAAWLRFR